MTKRSIRDLLRLERWAGSAGSVRRFVLTYALLAGIALSVYCFPYDRIGFRHDPLAGYLATYAKLAGACLALFDPSIHVSGALIRGRFSLEIVRSCDAMEINALFASALLALPAPLPRKLVVLVAGLGTLVALNVLRIASLYYIGMLAPTWFERAHLELWPLLLTAAAAALFWACATRGLGARPLGWTLK